LEAVLRHPERFSGLVIVDGRYTGGQTPQRDKLIAGCKADFSATMDAFVDACVQETDCEAEKAWGKQIVKRSNASAAIQMLECVENVELESRLKLITMPTLILHGSRDVITPLASSENLHALIPNSKLVVAEGAGHVPTVTRPVWVAEQINQFFGT
jgi:pimeloyl-ACP methyl ester carboxylesterase